jgi:prophage maintenance system killer protein
MIRSKGIFFLLITLFWTSYPYTEALAVRDKRADSYRKNSGKTHRREKKQHLSCLQKREEVIQTPVSSPEATCRLNFRDPCTIAICSLLVSTALIGTYTAIQSEKPKTSLKTDPFPFLSRSYTLAPQPFGNCTIELDTRGTPSWPEPVQRIVHPGIYVAPTSFKSRSEIILAVAEIPEARISIAPGESESQKARDNLSLLIPRLQERFRIGVIDGEPQALDALEAKGWLNALEYVDEKIIPYPIEKMKFKDFEAHLFKVNAILTNSSEAKTYKSGHVIVPKSPKATPQFQHTKSMANYLAIHDPSNLYTYNDLVSLLDQIKKELINQRLMQDSAETEKYLWYTMIAEIFENPAYHSPERLSLCKKYYHFDNSTQKNRQDKMKLGFQKAVSFLKEEKIFDAAAALHQTIVGPHVCPDANGRTARAFVLGLLKQKKLPLIAPWSDEHYTRAVNQAFESGSDEPFIDYIKSEVCRSQSFAAQSVKEEDGLTTTLLTCKAPNCQRDVNENLVEMGILH